MASRVVRCIANDQCIIEQWREFQETMATQGLASSTNKPAIVC